MRYTKLFFFAADKIFNLDIFTRRFDLKEYYYCVVDMPEIEFMSKTIPELGEEVVHMTTTAAWLSTGKRRVTYGDIIQYRDKFYGFVPNLTDKDIKDGLSALFGEIYHMPNVRPLLLVKIHEKETVYG